MGADCFNLVAGAPPLQASTPSPFVAAMGKMGACGFSWRTALSNASRSKLNTGRVSTLFSTTASATWNTPGYLSGLSSPSGTDRIMTFAFSPRSKSVGHTRLPTFSTMMRSRRARSSTSTARLSMALSRWHAPPVLICTAGMPWALMRSASTLLAMSPSMTAMLNSSRSASMVARMVDVLPDPGLAKRSSTNTRFSANRARSSEASWSFLSRMGCFISICMMAPYWSRPA